MALVYQKLTLEVTPGMIPPVLHVTEYDENMQVEVQLLQRGQVYEIPSGTTAKVEGTLAGHPFSVDATPSGSTVTFELTKGMTAYAGRAWTKIKLTKDGKPVSTCGFWLECDRAGVEAGAVIQDSGFQEQINEAVADVLGDSVYKLALNSDGFMSVVRIDNPTPDEPDEPVVTSLLDMNRTETSDVSNYLSEDYYINPSSYSQYTPSGSACTVANLSSNSITVTSNSGGIGCAYPLLMDSLKGKTLKLTWDATGTTDTRLRLLCAGNGNWQHAVIDQSGTKTESTIAISADGMTVTVDGTAVSASTNPFTFIAVFFGAATGKTTSYTNVNLAEV